MIGICLDSEDGPWTPREVIGIYLESEGGPWSPREVFGEDLGGSRSPREVFGVDLDAEYALSCTGTTGLDNFNYIFKP